MGQSKQSANRLQQLRKAWFKVKKDEILYDLKKQKEMTDFD